MEKATYPPFRFPQNGMKQSLTGCENTKTGPNAQGIPKVQYDGDINANGSVIGMLSQAEENVNKMSAGSRNVRLDSDAFRRGRCLHRPGRSLQASIQTGGCGHPPLRIWLKLIRRDLNSRLRARSGRGQTQPAGWFADTAPVRSP